MRAGDVMVRAVVTASPDTSVDGLARLMINLSVSGVPVLDSHGRLVGIVTEGDLLAASRPERNGTSRAGASRFHRMSGSPPSTSNRTRDAWRTS